MIPEDQVPGPIADSRNVDATDGSFVDIDNVSDAVQDALESQGIDQLFQHQQETLDALQNQQNVVISTPTASGKSLTYMIPALESALEGKKTLYIAPMTALINDQAETLKEYAEAAGIDPDRIARYTGQMSSGEKKRVREREPDVLLTTIDMVHMSLLPFATKGTWSWFFEDLDNIVVDELHEFRGVFGSHVSLVFRRLHRILDRYDRMARVIACSATIGNPVEHATKVTGFTRWESIEDDTSISGEKHWIVADNDESPHMKAKSIMENLLTHNIQTVTFTRARQAAERYAKHTQHSLEDNEHDELAEKVAPYHAALNDDERRYTEKDIKHRNLLGVWSTKALEVGVDVGTLDAAVLDGYPGSRMEVQQQAGRAGRGDAKSYVYLVPGTDALDQYMANNPDELFGEPEEAQVNPANSEILPRHLGQAAREQPLTRKDAMFFPDFEATVEKAEEKGMVKQTGKRWHATDKMQGRPFGLRNVKDRNIDLVDSERGKRITSLGYGSAIKDAYPDAIYMHQGDRYEVTEFDQDGDVAYLQPLTYDPDYYTSPQKEKRIEVHDELEAVEQDGVRVFLADVTVHGNVTGYFKKRKSDNKTIGTEDYGIGNTLPFSFRTKAIGFDLQRTPDTGNLGDGLHAAEHAMIGVMPLHVLCDRRNDLGGLSIELHSHTGNPTIFIHEGHEGGVGLVDTAFENLHDIVEEAETTVADCDCDNGCGTCIYSPTCGNANEHLDKEDGSSVLAFLKDALSEAEE